MNSRLARYFDTRDLVTIGLFAGAAKASSLLLALVGGGMNPVTMILKSMVFSALWVIMLVKAPKFGALTLANLVAGLLGFFLLGQAVISLPALIAATLLVELLILTAGGFKKRRLAAAVVAVGTSELLMRAVSVFFSYLGAREQPGLMVMVLVISAFSYLGILLGLPAGLKMVKELRRAGLIQN